MWTTTDNMYGLGWSTQDPTTHHGPDTRPWARDHFFMHSGKFLLILRIYTISRNSDFQAVP
jgi:hypothetical protein